MELVDGHTIWDGTLPDVPRADRRAHYGAMIDTMAALHSIDQEAVGLADFGRPGSYIQRQVDRWIKQYRASQTDDLPLLPVVAADCLPIYNILDDELAPRHSRPQALLGSDHRRTVFSIPVLRSDLSASLALRSSNNLRKPSLMRAFPSALTDGNASCAAMRTSPDTATFGRWRKPFRALRQSVATCGRQIEVVVGV